MHKKTLYFDPEAFIREGEAGAKCKTPNDAVREIVRTFAVAINKAYERGYEDGADGAERKAEYMNGPEMMERAERENGITPDVNAREITALFIGMANEGYQCGYKDGAADGKEG